ncbi:class I SAM-dependent methyltransferase [Shouchella sp. 1P09AA]|uniref:class I SAM-dependent DNA methyltransferase n=1 Tax=unclassified Shouchella TaxID=2893065 RepID=UPI0039A2F8EA
MIYNNVFSSVYNKKFNNFSRVVGPMLYEYLQDNLSLHKKNKILDVCCGTGTLANFFLQKGHEVTGIDLSEDMLNHAIKNNSEFVHNGYANFYLCDASNFQLDETFSFVFSTYDSLNHLDNFSELTSCFESVYNVMDNNGIFIFDLNTYLGLSKSTGMVINEDNNQLNISQSFYDPISNKASTNYRGFVKTNRDELYVHYNQTIYNTIYKLNEVKTYLLENGWFNVQFTDARNLNKVLTEPENEQRVFIIAQKKTK